MCYPTRLPDRGGGRVVGVAFVRLLLCRYPKFLPSSFPPPEMANLIALPNSFLPSSSPLVSTSTPQRSNPIQNLVLCKSTSSPRPSHPFSLCRRFLLCSTISSFTLPLSDLSKAAILEADDDEELLERVKKDRKKRLEKQGAINSAKNETAYLQELVYKLSKVGQAIDNNDFSVASSVLGPNTNSDWIKNINSAFNKLSSSSEEKTEVDIFNSSLTSLISSVSKNDIESSKLAFVSSASALEKWTALTGLVGQLKGL